VANVLIVDDSATMRQMIAYTLESAGHRTTEAPDGKAALELASVNAYDLIITDVNMPGMNGLELTRSLRARAETKSTPILVLTTEGGPEKKGEGRAAGATGWIVKPFDPEALMKVLPRVLG
jgi:two-component system, chemotaxis family, chemotaxis protein CheY